MPLIRLLCLWWSQHVSGTIMPIVRSSRRWRWLPHKPSGSRVAAGRKLKCRQDGWVSGPKAGARIVYWNIITTLTHVWYSLAFKILAMNAW